MVHRFRMDNNLFISNDFDFDDLTGDSESASMKRVRPKKKKPKPELSEYEIEMLKQEHEAQPPKYHDRMDPYEKARIEQLFQKMGDKWVGANGKKRSVYSCTLCEREVRSDKRVKHLRSNHPE